ncbi:uridine kinase [Candidatus Woesearchaeota archaeon]|jgi:uridine kinase|nr:uridine kinase [Candidatus Woesearchaeota archaeon]
MSDQASNGRKRLLMLIGGASGSGKTTIAKNLVGQVSREIGAIHLSMDDWYPDNSHLSFEDRCKLNFDDPKIFDYDLLYRQLADLKRGRRIDKPIYSFEEHTRTDNVLEVEPCDLIILEGIYALFDPRIVKLADYAYFVDTPIEECVIRRMERDIAERGRDLKEVSGRLRRDVIPAYHKHVKLTANNAPYRIDWKEGHHEVVMEGLVRLVRSYF